MPIADFRREIEGAAREQRLDPNVVEAVVLVESGADPWAFNPEPRYRYFWDVTFNKPFRRLTAAELASKRPPNDFRAIRIGIDPDTEWWGQQASWGLMQVMGAVARERGFRGPFLSMLCEPSIGLAFGCSHLAAYLRANGGDLERAVQAYNAGPGGVGSPLARIYSTKVFRALEQIQKARQA